MVRAVSEFSDSLNGIKYPCAMCEKPAVIWSRPDAQGRYRWCGEHFDRLALETLATPPNALPK